MAELLLAGESWVSASVDHKGYDAFPHTQIHIGCKDFLAALTSKGHHVTHLRSHDVAEMFPTTMEELSRYDVVILSDIGSNSLLLSPAVFEQGRPAPNRLRLLAEWVRSGGGLMMAGGYLSFQGFEGKANYAQTPVEDVLPVTIQHWDDRVEEPQGVQGRVVAEHPVVAGLDQTWPILLGYQRLTTRDDAQLLATAEGDPLLVVRDVGRGRSAAFASDISPHWAPREFTEWQGYSQLFSQLVDWLAHNPSDRTREGR
ncbi:glutamine amidotransferase [Propionibacterium freudenreichii]|jgi:uncharacterized membrane protein|uniref:glutamine amidotransferase n=1 Tax=Propionibacterium freudenreichii TaxID=1744 RepID=UPI0005429D66|nr:glutamine amidotransferase [Propionibacterium freudenreichii]MCT2999966.1 cytoplasmic protein [Propionibacterium freudenreichii]MDK9647532.1 cytoplasmic protein [Propionibacterium freudenreichii]MDK9655745.1 cytoplasmic protein [Propionibacterium freudenreichii]MDK9666841.1 cytoplasmic protein [Propionibacterium freudenreichii]CEG94227.1 Cytoplasmic protein [Propionibacterium freudenreichii]